MRGAAIELWNLGEMLHQLSSSQAALQVIQKVVDGVDRRKIINLHQAEPSRWLKAASVAPECFSGNGDRLALKVRTR